MKTRGKRAKVRLKMDPVECYWCNRPHNDLRDLWSGHTSKNKKEYYGQMMVQCFDFNAADWKDSKVDAKICPSCAKRLRGAVHFKQKLFGVSITTEDDLFSKEKDFIPYSSVEKTTEFVNMKEAAAVTDGNTPNDPFDTDTASVKEEVDSGNEDTTAALAETLTDTLVMEIKDEEHLDEELLTGIEGANNRNRDELTSINDTTKIKTPDLQCGNTGFVEFDQPEHLEVDHWEEYIEQIQPDDRRACNARMVTSKQRIKKVKIKRNPLHQSKNTDTYYKSKELTTLLKLTNATPFAAVPHLKGLSCVYCKVIAGKSPAFIDADVFRAHVQNEHDAVRLGMAQRFKRLTKQSISVDITDLRCTWCDVPLPSWQLMFTHLHRVHSVTKLDSLKTGAFPYILPANLRDIRCALCPHTTLTLLQQVKHTRTHYYVHKCDRCGLSFKHETQLVTHHTSCDGGAFICDHCSCVYKKRTQLVKHLSRVASQAILRADAYKCAYCDKTFEIKRKLQEHTFDEHVYPGFRCTACRRTFGVIDAFLDHYNTCHNHGNDTSGPEKECIECKNKFSLQNLYKVKENGQEKDICKDCFQNTRQTVFHNGVRLGFKCHICGLNHTTESSLVLHWSKYHQAEWLKTTGFEKLPLRPVTCIKDIGKNGDNIECNVCKLHFNLKFCYKMYENNREEHICKLCFLYTRQANYQYGVKLGYKCHYCGIKFNFKSSISRHYFRVHRSEWLKTSGHMNHLDPFREGGPRNRISKQNMPPKTTPNNSNTDNCKTIKTITERMRQKHKRKEHCILTEHNYTVFKCDLCCYTGPIEGIRDHYRRNHRHGSNIKENSQCFKCKIKFSRKNLFQINGKERGINLCNYCFLKTRQIEYKNGIRISSKCFKYHICGCKCKQKASLFNHYDTLHRNQWRAMRGLSEKPPRARKRVKEESCPTNVETKRRRRDDDNGTECPYSKDNKGKPSESTKPQHITLLRVYTK